MKRQEAKKLFGEEFVVSRAFASFETKAEGSKGMWMKRECSNRASVTVKKAIFQWKLMAWS